MFWNPYLAMVLSCNRRTSSSHGDPRTALGGAATLYSRLVIVGEVGTGRGRDAHRDADRTASVAAVIATDVASDVATDVDLLVVAPVVPAKALA
jgi:hypothetical protein